MLLLSERRDAMNVASLSEQLDALAYYVLGAGFVVLPILVGIDKFSDRMVDWSQYVWPRIPDALHISMSTFLHAAGVVEITAGVLVLLVPRLGAPVVS